MDRRLCKRYSRTLPTEELAPNVPFKNGATARFTPKKPALPAGLSPYSVTLASWNLNGCRDPLGIESEANEARAKVIGDLKPDILALQEVGKLQQALAFQSMYLKKAYRHCMVISGNCPFALNLGIFSRFPMEAYTHRDRSFDVPGLHPMEFRRDLLIARLKLAPWFRLNLGVIHFKSGVKRETWRLGEASITHRILSSYAAEKDFKYMAVVGDANDQPKSQTVETLNGSLLFDLFREEGKPNQPTWHGPRGEEARLDYACVNSDLASLYVAKSAERVGVSPKASDHDLIFFRFRVPNPPDGFRLTPRDPSAKRAPLHWD